MITLLKLGGSLITDKDSPHTARPDVIRRLGKEIYDYWKSNQSPLIIGHGSGSFGHIPAKRYGTRQGIKSAEDWVGFAEVHAEAAALNQIVTHLLRESGLPIISFVPMNQVKTEDRYITQWDTSDMVKSFSEYGLIPLIFGDTVFDTKRNGTILSTEDLFEYLCGIFAEKPRILLAGLEEGVWYDFPQKTKLITEISTSDKDDESFIQGSASTDVTGGMREKVRLMKELVRNNRAQSVSIFSGEKPGNLTNALHGIQTGTTII